MASVAHVDPANVAANVTSGARYDYQFLWVLGAANGIAMVVQYLSRVGSQIHEFRDQSALTRGDCLSRSPIQALTRAPSPTVAARR